MITATLKWDTHIHYIIKKANKSLYCLRILKQILSKAELIKVYNSYTRSILEYSNPLLCGLNPNLQQKLDKFQRRAHRIICEIDCPNQCLADLRIRRNRQSINLLLKAKSSLNTINSILPTSSQFSNRFILPHCNSNRRLQSFVIKSCIRYNQSLNI